uniref:Elongation factor 4 n=1 Tax=Anthurium amnicola TaxID=1678845 RepID=A0A1D1YLI5_9ARAE
MGCVCSGGVGKVDRDALSFSEAVGAGAGDGLAVHGRKAAKAFYDSGELKRVPGKAGASKASEMSSIMGRAGSAGLEKAVEVLDTLGSSMSNFKTGNGFMSGMVYRGNKVSILAFEVANTIAKGATLMRSLSVDNVQFLKKEILQSDGVQRLISTDMKELLGIVASDKREELDVFSKEVVRFGDLCRDPQWHNLARYFQKLDLDLASQQELKEEAETTMQQLMNLAHHTSELYHELHALDRFEQDYRQKLQEEEPLPPSRRGEKLTILHSELKHQRKLVKSLKKKSLWSRNSEEVVEKLVDIVAFLHQEISEAFGSTGSQAANWNSDRAPSRLGSSGLALHYANVVNQIDNIVSRPMSLPPNTRDTLYHGLPIVVKAALRSRLQSFHVKEELTVAQIKAEMQKTLQWLVPMAENTVKVHQGFGWVGEWANMGTELNKKPVQHDSVIRIQTLHHAVKEKTDEYILQLAVWLHHLVMQVKNRGFGFKAFNSVQYPCQKDAFLSLERKQDLSLPCNDKTPVVFQLSEEDREMLRCIDSKRMVLGRSKSLGCITKEKKVRRWESRSSGNSPSREINTGLDFQFERRKVLDVIDGLDTLEPPFPIAPFYA